MSIHTIFQYTLYIDLYQVSWNLSLRIHVKNISDFIALFNSEGNPSETHFW